MFQMNRISDGKDIQEQKKENTLPPVTLETIERGVPGFDPSKAFISEQGRVNRNRMTDIELCNIIDNMILPAKYFKPGQESSIYLLPESKRAEIGNAIWKEWKDVRFRKYDSIFAEKIITEDQVRRCLCLPSGK